MSKQSRSEQSVSREPSPGGVTVRLRLRVSALEALVNDGLPVRGTMKLVEQLDGAFSICIWSAEMPDWPDPVPGNAAALMSRSDSHPYANPSEASCTRHERSRNIQIRALAALFVLRGPVSLARRCVGLRLLRRRVVPGPRSRIRSVRPALRRHYDGRGVTITAPHPGAPETLSVDILAVRWGRHGRGVHPNWWGLRTAVGR